MAYSSYRIRKAALLGELGYVDGLEWLTFQRKVIAEPKEQIHSGGWNKRLCK